MLDKIELWEELTQSSTLLYLENIKIANYEKVLSLKCLPNVNCQGEI